MLNALRWYALTSNQKIPRGGLKLRGKADYEINF